MDFTNEIVSFVSDRIGGICIIAVGSGEIVYADSYFTKKYGCSIVGQDSDALFLWLQECPKLEADSDAQEWEYIETDTKTYLRIISSCFEKDNKLYSIHQMTDITEYMGLNRDVTKYMSFFKKLSAFQNAVMEKLSDSYYELLSMTAEYFRTNKTYIFLQKDEKIEIISYNAVGKQYTYDAVENNVRNSAIFGVDAYDNLLIEALPEDIKEVFLKNGAKADNSIRLLTANEASGDKFAIFLNVWPNMDEQSIHETMLKNVINLYIENGIMREKLLYESEHDGLTGLYNKGKYLELMENVYCNLDTIGVFNLDVNNLKKMNDTYGHEAGDKLIIKAATSIRKVMSDKVHGFRVGGDEFMMIVSNPTEDEVREIKARWEKELSLLNDANDGIDCVIASGVCYGAQGFDINEVLKKADELMYEDKKSKKLPGEEIR